MATCLYYKILVHSGQTILKIILVGDDENTFDGHARATHALQRL